MNIRQFECLRAIMTTGSMTQAAERLGISQPSASSLISNLEYTLGFKLFDRVKGRLVATPEAKHFLPDVTRALDSIDLAMRQAKQIRDNRYGDLTIASYPDIAIDFLPGVMSAFLADAPDVRMRLLARRSEMMSGLLPMQEFDMAIVTQVVETRQFEIEKIQMPCVVAYCSGHAPPSQSVGPTDLQVRTACHADADPSDRDPAGGTVCPGGHALSAGFGGNADFRIGLRLHSPRRRRRSDRPDYGEPLLAGRHRNPALRPGGQPDDLPADAGRSPGFEPAADLSRSSSERIGGDLSARHRSSRLSA